MSRDSLSARWGQLSGLLVAGIGFGLTRFTVTLAVYDQPAQFLLAGVLPLVLGLSIAAFGVALSVGAFDPAYVHTVALWCVLGTGSMGVMVLVTLYGTDPGVATDLVALRSRTYFSNFLIGGCFGGTLTGVYAARNREKRIERQEHAKRMAVLNRVFRDRVLNAVTVIRGRIDLLGDGADATEDATEFDVISDQVASLERTVAELKHITGSEPATAGRTRVDLVECVRSSAATARDRFPHAEVVVQPTAETAPVWANGLLEHAIDQLVENAVIHSDRQTPRVELGVERDAESIRVTVADDGPGLTPDQQRMVERGTFAEFDDPSTGFGLNLVTLLVEGFGGTVSPSVTAGGTSIELTLPVAASADPDRDLPSRQARGVSADRLAIVGVSALLAGVAMGVVGNLLTGLVPVVGVLYGVEDPLVGWVTHEFHSVVFGVVYAGLLRAGPARFQEGLRGRLAVALGLGLVLWLVAAGVVTPLWLRLLGIPTPVPDLSLPSLGAHAVWAVTLGTLYSVGLDARDDWR